jgi:hypothetical protein
VNLPWGTSEDELRCRLTASYKLVPLRQRSEYFRAGCILSLPRIRICWRPPRPVPPTTGVPSRLSACRRMGRFPSVGGPDGDEVVIHFEPAGVGRRLRAQSRTWAFQAMSHLGQGLEPSPQGCADPGRIAVAPGGFDEGAAGERLPARSGPIVGPRRRSSAPPEPDRGKPSAAAGCRMASDKMCEALLRLPRICID